MRIDLKSALSSLPLPATAAWPEDVWDKTVFSHGIMSLLVFIPRGRDDQNHLDTGVANSALIATSSRENSYFFMRDREFFPNWEQQPQMILDS
jgi:hypothetical protein